MCGHLKMKEAIWRVDPDGDFKFSDGTNPNQIVLFETDTRSPLIELLRKRFTGRGVITVKAVRQYVEDETAYLKKHMTAALKQEEADQRVVVNPVKADGKHRRRNTYPDNSLITFA